MAFSVVNKKILYTSLELIIRLPQGSLLIVTDPSGSTESFFNDHAGKTVVIKEKFVNFGRHQHFNTAPRLRGQNRKKLSIPRASSEISLQLLLILNSTVLKIF